MDLGVHIYDLLRHLLGDDMEVVHAQLETRIPQRPTRRRANLCPWTWTIWRLFR